MITYGSLFAGVGGFDLGFDRAGIDCRWQVEKDPSCQKLLKKEWPKAKQYGDITAIRTGELERVDVVCGGSPCQGLSVAGLREGLADGRSGLFHQMVRVCKDQRRRGGARIVVWENVDGAFSSNDGRDFALVLCAFTGVAVEVPPDGWGRAGFIKTPFPSWRWNCAWRLFDAQYFGVPQRRRRVFLVASLGTGSCAEILFECESLRGDPPPSRGAREGFAGSLGARSSGGGGLGTDVEIAGGLQASSGGCDENDARDGRLIPEIAGTIGASGAGTARPSGNENQKDLLIPETVGTLDTFSGCDRKIGNQQALSGHLIAREVAHSLCVHQVKRGDPTTDNYVTVLDARNQKEGDVAHSLRTGCGDAIPIAFNHQAGGSLCPISPSLDRANCLQVGQGQAVAFKPSHFTRGKDGPPSDIAPPPLGRRRQGRSRGADLSNEDRAQRSRSTGVGLSGAQRDGRGRHLRYEARSRGQPPRPPTDPARVRAFDGLARLPHARIQRLNEVQDVRQRGRRDLRRLDR